MAYCLVLPCTSSYYVLSYDLILRHSPVYYLVTYHILILFCIILCYTIWCMLYGLVSYCSTSSYRLVLDNVMLFRLILQYDILLQYTILSYYIILC